MRNDHLKLATPGEIAALVLATVVLFIACFGIAQGCAYAEQTPEQYLATVQSHLHVPEPIDLHFWLSPSSCFDCMEPVTATVHYVKLTGRWKIVMSEDWWMEAGYAERLEVLSHEVCHIAYDHDVLMPDLWYALPVEEIKSRQQRAESCSVDTLRRIVGRR